MPIFNFLASLSSWAGLFESGFVGNPKDRFSRDKAHIRIYREGGIEISVSRITVWQHMDFFYPFSQE